MKRVILLLLLFQHTPLVCGQGTLQFAATLSGINEPAPNASPVAGTASFALTGNKLTYSVHVWYFDTNGPVAVPLGDGVGGTLGSAYFDIPIQVTINNSRGPISSLSLPAMNDPGLAPGGGIGFDAGFDFYWTDYTASLHGNQINQLESGSWFVNVTTGDFPNGEIRGQLAPVPEPGSWTLLICGASALFARHKAKRPGPLTAVSKK